MSATAGAGLRATAAAGVGKSLWLSYGFVGPAGEAPARPRLGRGNRALIVQLARVRSPGPRSFGVPRVSAPQPEDRQSHRPRCLRVTASRRPGQLSSRCYRRSERSRDIIQGWPPSCGPYAAPSPVSPGARRAVLVLLPFGTLGLLFWTHGCAGFEGEVASPARAAARRAPPARSARRGSSQAPGKVARRGGGGGWWAEAVGGGGDSPPISPKSKVFPAVSRTGSRGI